MASCPFVCVYELESMSDSVALTEGLGDLVGSHVGWKAPWLQQVKTAESFKW